ncbi:hypothetical protein [Streptomyces sp. NPDC059928]|uniref:hypothetical protein n=1 Tax=unclassified Streptomyces TaxID=2593676 RepID=UPI00365E1DBC
MSTRRAAIDAHLIAEDTRGAVAARRSPHTWNARWARWSSVTGATACELRPGRAAAGADGT